MATTKLNETAEKVLNFLKANKGKEFTLAEIAEGIGKPMKSTGAFISLVTNGTITKGAPREVERKVTAKVSTYKVEDTGEETGEETIDNASN